MEDKRKTLSEFELSEKERNIFNAKYASEYVTKVVENRNILIKKINEGIASGKLENIANEVKELSYIEYALHMAYPKDFPIVYH